MRHTTVCFKASVGFGDLSALPSQEQVELGLCLLQYTLAVFSFHALSFHFSGVRGH